MKKARVNAQPALIVPIIIFDQKVAINNVPVKNGETTASTTQAIEKLPRNSAKNFF